MHGDDKGKSSEGSELHHNGGNDSSADMKKMNAHFMKKLPKGAEASNILVMNERTFELSFYMVRFCVPPSRLAS